jgi:hypothetical protein
MMGPCEGFARKIICPLWATTPLLAVCLVGMNGPTHKYRENTVGAYAIMPFNSGAVA